MKKKDDIQRKEVLSKNIADDDLASLKAQINDMQLEIDLLKETINVLKKDRGVDLTSLKNREKTAMIDAMKNKHPLVRMDTEDGRMRCSIIRHGLASALMNSSIF